MTTGTLVVFALALMVNAGSPGPSIAALVSRVLTNGVRDVLPFLAAMWLGEAVWLTLALTGLAALVEAFGSYVAVLRYLGVAYLIYLAWRMWTAPAELPDGEMPAQRRPWRMFGAGLLVTLGNPKIMVFYVALLPTIVDIRAVTLAGWLGLTATLLIVLAGIDLAWAFAASRARRLLRSPRAVRIANRTGAAAMSGAAVAIAAR